MFENFYINIKLEEGGIVPRQGTDESAGFDVYSPIDFVVRPGEDILVPLNWRCEFPKGYALLMANKSGLAVKFQLINGAELIDSDYRGICHAHIFNFGKRIKRFERGDKISQFIVIPIWNGEVNIVKELNMNTKRGQGGFGSTGEK